MTRVLFENIEIFNFLWSFCSFFEICVEFLVNLSGQGSFEIEAVN